ncbi:Zn(II)2Cys6 transcription factor [Aspergillus glaucus CBS 516.65]|uniref:Zn(2)-C6 fungal-type domain-containing protein n=1 Tax=Aspergillus glaucus CBS 516.65 TaxID=1160497 RepID=A0A1L9VCR8_ASPGL|nr:hypothetical protein ASPGLDRAFT_647214 [Aspergillus glaucus CBS 516.65]OJJ81706.1 hypothetical protein ASPGLDRAFT_647214 [Aspergillus glaucus CBS 516.65]
MDSNTNLKKRKPHKKSRRGCQTCRTRRVKCDETLPSCNRCTRTGWKCQYPDPLSSPSSIPSFFPSRTFNTQREYQYFDFFRFQTVTDLSGWFSSYFWHRLVLQMSHSEGVVKRVAVALGALQMDGSYAGTDQRMALQYYNEALSGLRGLLGSTGMRSIDVALTTCILISCFEVFRRDYTAAQMHYTSGLEILKLWRGTKTYTTVDYPYPSRSQAVIPCYERALIEHFSLLETQIISFLQSRPGFAQDAVLFEQSISKIPIPMDFSTLNEAKETFILIMNTTMNLSTRAKNRLVFKTEDEPERDENSLFRHRETYNASVQFAAILRTLTGECQLALTQWMDAFDTLYRRIRSNMSVQETMSTSVLWLVYTVLYTLFARDFSKGEMGYDTPRHNVLPILHRDKMPPSRCQGYGTLRTLCSAVTGGLVEPG